MNPQGEAIIFEFQRLQARKLYCHKIDKMARALTRMGLSFEETGRRMGNYRRFLKDKLRLCGQK